MTNSNLRLFATHRAAPRLTTLQHSDTPLTASYRIAPFRNAAHLNATF